ncbi:MAG: methionyl-tRNA formyltransferase, partial [Phycisphaerae bacterium]
MRILFLGSGVFGEPTLRHLAQSDHEIAAVITQPARASGRGQRRTRTPVAAVAEELGLNVIEAENVNTPEFVESTRKLDAKLGLVIAFGQMLRNDFLSTTPGGFINLHASLLPKYRGAAPINWAIVEGEERTGCTVFRIDERMDAGPILSSRWTAIKPEETAGELHDRLAGVGVDAVNAALELYEQEERPAGTVQDDSLATRAPKLKKTDGYIDFNMPAARIAGLVCGMTPWPGVSVRFEADDGRWEQMQVIRARVAETSDTPSISPGT